MSLMDNLRILRERGGYKNAKDFASLLGVKYSSYLGYETKGVWPTEKTLFKIADTLHVTVDDLLGYKVDELQFWLKKWRDSLPGISIEVSDDKIVINQSKFPNLPSIVFPSKEEFVFQSNICLANAQKEYDKALSTELYNSMFYQALLQYNEAEKQLNIKRSKRSQKTDNE